MKKTSNSNQSNPTPWDFFRAVEKYYGLSFKYDMAASIENSKCPNFFSEKHDSLSIDWPTNGPCWLNPTFFNLTKWIDKCEEQYKRGCHIVTIWPLSCDKNQKSTWDLAEVTVVHGRVWKEVRGVMLCEWSLKANRHTIHSVDWDSENGILIKNW